MNVEQQDLTILLKQLDDKVQKLGLCGYDPRLLWYLPAAKLYHQKKNKFTNFLRKAEVATYRFMPFIIKPYLRISKVEQGISPYGLGLAIQAYVNYYRLFKDSKYLDTAVKIETQLSSYLVTTANGNIGVPTPPEDNFVFSLPAGAEVALAYLDLFSLTQNKYYLSQANKIANSFISDHQVKYLEGDRISIDYYSNQDNLHVLNANALAALVFHRIDLLTNSQTFQIFINGIINYITPYLHYEQLPYSGIEDKYNKNVTYSGHFMLKKVLNVLYSGHLTFLTV